MLPDTGDIPFVEFSHEALEKSLSADVKGEEVGKLSHDGVDYRFLGPVKRNGAFWWALEQIHRSGKYRIIAFRLVPEHKVLTIAYEIKTGLLWNDKMALQAEVERVIEGYQPALIPA